MAKEKSSYFYNIKKLNLLFAVAAAAFLGIVVWTVLDDADREWKHFQKRFNRLEYKKTKRDLEEAKKGVDHARLKEFQKLLKEAEAAAKDSKSAVAQASKAVDGIAAKLYVVNSEYQIQKSLLDTAKYRYEEAAKHDPGHAAKEKAEMDRLMKIVSDYGEEIKGLEKFKAEEEARLAEITASQEQTREQINAQRKEMDKILKKLNKVKPSLWNDVRDMPILDFLAPNLKIHQLLPEGLQDDYNFVKVPKVDRCTTCHLGIDKKGYEQFPQPFTTHPDLDLYLGNASPHPMEKFGCTSCHLGNGRGTSFETAAHTPSNTAQEKEWKKKYGWHPDKHWPWPMLPKNEVEATCISCHAGVMEVPRADKLNAARNLFAELGCVGCHATEGFMDLRKIGPSLEHIGSKVEADWMRKWIENPKSFDPHARMPRFFGLSNAPMDERQQAIVGSIAAYLMDHSTPLELPAVTETGDPKKGQELARKVGCLGCHSVGQFKANDFGPGLDGAGSKMNMPWLVAWLKDPKKLFPQTKMPDLRLTDQEAVDIASFLMTLKNPKFDAEPVSHVQQAALDGLALAELKKKKTAKDAQVDLAGMDEKQKELLVGKAMILHYGCFGCHDIPGFEDAKKIGTELTEEGDKPVGRFDFGFVPIDHTRGAFFRQKLKDPRSFDTGKVKTDSEKLKMPQFDLTPEQIELLSLHLTSLVKHTVPLDRQKVLSSDEQWAEKGRAIVRNFNCQGCHVMDGKGGKIADTLEDKGFAPPLLDGEGKKVKGDWLYTFLRNPTAIRPWLHFRMPTFGFTDEQASTLVRHFQGKDRVPVAFKSLEKPTLDQAVWDIGHDMFGKLQCLQCHQTGPGVTKSAAELAPDLGMAAERLREDWIVEWLKDPQVLQPGTRMPTYFPEGQSPLPQVLGGKTEDQIQALKTFIVNYKAEK